MSRRALLLLAALALFVAPAVAQTGFHVTHNVGEPTATSVEVTGTVTNQTRAEALDVSVTVEAYGANGKRIARGITFVSPRLSAGATANFVAKVPVVTGVAGYRASVTSYRFVQGIEGP